MDGTSNPNARRIVAPPVTSTPASLLVSFIAQFARDLEALHSRSEMTRAGLWQSPTSLRPAPPGPLGSGQGRWMGPA